MSNVYIGDRPLDPPEDEPCDFCGGWGWIDRDDGPEGCSACEGSGNSDPGEPNDPPED